MTDTPPADDRVVTVAKIERRIARFKDRHDRLDSSEDEVMSSVATMGALAAIIDHAEPRYPPFTGKVSNAAVTAYSIAYESSAAGDEDEYHHERDGLAAAIAVHNAGLVDAVVGAILAVAHYDYTGMVGMKKRVVAAIERVLRGTP